MVYVRGMFRMGQSRETYKSWFFFVYSGGFLFNIILALLFYALTLYLAQHEYHPIVLELVRVAILYNIMAVAFSIIPVVYPFGPEYLKGTPSDGLQIYRLLFKLEKVDDNK